MHEILQTLSAMDDGLITSEMFERAGVSRRDVARGVAAGALVRLRRGAYTEKGLWDALWPDGRHRLVVRATVGAAGRELVVSHFSAAAMHRLPTVGDWPRTLHILDPGASGGATSPLVTSHRGGVDMERVLSETVLVDGVRVTSLARTLVDIAGSTAMERAVPALDAALHRARVRAEDEAARTGTRRTSPQLELVADAAEQVQREQLHAELASARSARGFSRARAGQALDFANGLADGPGESLSRVRFLELGFEIPELQVCFTRPGGRLAYVDFWWRGIRKAGEFDGRYKYTRGAIVRPGQDPGEIAYAEKRREDELRPQMDSMTRWVWDHVLNPRTFLRFLTEHGVPRR